MPPIKSLTLLAAQTDFAEPGELGQFIDESQIGFLDAITRCPGYLTGEQMAGSFQFLHSRDLVWTRRMSDYLLGERGQPSDLMAWNADTTRMPARMHYEYLKQAEMLEHHADAQGTGLLRVAHLYRPVVPVDLAAVGLDRAIDDLHQRRFAGAVFAQYGVRFAGLHHERHIVVGHDRRIALDDVGGQAGAAYARNVPPGRTPAAALLRSGAPMNREREREREREGERERAA